MPNYYSDTVYKGPEAIVVAMDIGTTQSAVSFAHFVPGIHPEVQMVAHWPGRTYWTGSAKTPSMVSYRDGVVEECGAEALQDFEEHEENVAYWFKFHLHPALISQSNSSQSEIPPLPVGITIERVYADMMKYLMKHTQRFFETTTANGTEIWARLHDTIVIVLAIPNGWDIREQAVLRKAAIRASLVTEESAGQLLQFVTGSEASVHYALAHDPGEWLKKRTVFAVIDCGGSTVDTTVYRCVSTSPLSVAETCPSECVQAGGIFVDREVGKMLENKLKGSAFSDPGIIKRMTDASERELKPTFNGVLDRYDLKFGVVSDNDASLGIYKGRITLSNQELKPVFDTVIDKIVTGCLNALIRQKPKCVLIVGGFGESIYLRKVLSRKLAPYGVQMIALGDSAKKAVAEGAIIARIKQFVVARAARATFGGCVRQRYERRLHRERRHAVQVYADGKERIDGVFHVWIKKGAVLQGTFAYKLPYHVAWDATSTSKGELVRRLGTIEIEVFAWEYDDIPIWCKDEHGAVMNGMRLICTLNADLSLLARGLQIKTGLLGKRFYRVDYDVCVYFGGTQLRANLQWKERGALREGPVNVMPYVPPIATNPNQPLSPNSTLGAHASIGSTTQAHPFDSNQVSVSIADKNDAGETFKLSNQKNGVSLAEGHGVSGTLEKLMMDYAPCDLSGQVIIPDRGNPAQGGLADVYLGLFDKKEVAVKVLRIRKSRWDELEWESSNQRRITREMHVWSALKHRNICEFLGYSMDFSDYPAMISTWCHRGTASDYLESQELTVRERIRLALDVSEGLQYLHDLKVIHGDLKPTNVLVDDACVARLCDFGLVRIFDWEGPAGMTTTSPYTGTERYKAPELFATRDNRRPVATFEGDMYSLGSVMLELIERLYPFKRFARAAYLRDAIINGDPPALRSETTRAMSDTTDIFWDLLETCWSDPSGRPRVKEVVDALQGFARAMPPLSTDLSTLELGLQIRNAPRGKRSYRVDSDACDSSRGTQSALRESQLKLRPIAMDPNQAPGPKATLRAHTSVGSTTQAHSFDSNSVSASIVEKNHARETVESSNQKNDVFLAEGHGVSATLEKLMMDCVLCDLSGQVTIPDRGNPVQGGLADVHFGWFDKKEVAVKVLRVRKSRGANPYCETSNQRRITREMHVWSALKHRNICEFLGYSRDFSHYPAMISTWYRHGTAYNYLESQELSVRERIRLALDISEGLQYLHDLKFIHGDLKPTNVLVDDTYVGRLCDFGLVRLLDWEVPAKMTATSQYTVTERYKAPELFVSRDNRRPAATFEGDIYSLGCIMLEFIELLHPSERFTRAADPRDSTTNGLYPALRSETTRALSDMTDPFWDLLETCWSNPSSRPSIKEVVDALQGFARAMPPTS